MTLRRLLSLILLLVAGRALAAGACAARLEPADWQLYQSRFISAEGRVVDTGNGGISHSEGQAFALLLAEAFADREAFERIWNWSRTQLQVRDDALLAWRWDPGRSREPVTDRNNASDGDLILAWALYRGGERWAEPAYTRAAGRISAAIAAKLIRDAQPGPLLLPGAEGFERTEGPVVNPSYWVFPALAGLARHEDDPLWNRLIDTGLALLEAGRFGRWQLPPDWLQWTGDGPRPAPGWEPRFGYDAIRVPLYLTWAGLENEHRLTPFLDFWSHYRDAHLPPWVDLQDDSVAGYPAGPGFEAVAAVSRFAAGRGGALLQLPPLDPDSDYYQSSLALLAQVAAVERCRS